MMMMMTPLFTKKKDEADELRLRRVMTANEFMNIKDIQNDIVYTRDNHLFVYLKLPPVSLELLSDNERNLLGKKFTAKFSAIKRPFKIFSVSRPVDVSFILNNLKALQQEASGVRKQVISEKIKEIHDFTYTGEILEHQFYIILWAAAAKNAERSLIKSAHEIAGYCKECGVNAEICRKSDIVKLLNLFANPNCAHLEDDDIQEHIPWVT